MSSNLMAKRFFREYKLVASEVGAKIEILRQTACMSSNKRLIIAYSQAFRKYFSQDAGFNEFLEKKAEPALTLIGHGEWPRDILTDMGLKISLKKKKASLKKLGETGA